MTANPGTEEFAANLAMAHLGQSEIATMQDSTTRARAVRQFFAVARDATLRLKWWNFATGWVTPAQVSGAAAGPLKNRFQLPADCVRVRFVEDAEDDDWAVETGSVLVGGTPADVPILVTNLTAPNICYTRRVESVQLWDALFLDQFGFELAALCARKCGRSASFAEALRVTAKEKLHSAAGVDSKERARQRPVRATSWTRARSGRQAYQE